MLVSVRIDSRVQAKQDTLANPSLSDELVKQLQFIEVVHYNSAHSQVQGQIQFLWRLVVAVEVDLVGREIHRLGDSEFSPRYHVEPQAFFLEYQS